MEENYSIAKNKVFYSVVALAIIGIVNICFVSFAGEYATAYSVDNPWLLFLFPVLMSSAYIYYFVALGHLKRAIVEDCVRAVVLLRISSALLAFSSLLETIIYIAICYQDYTLWYVFGIVGASAAFIVEYLVSMAAFIIGILGSNRLRISKSFSGRDGAKILFIAMLLLIVGALLPIVPMSKVNIQYISVSVSKILSILVYVSAFVLIVFGWKKIKDYPRSMQC